MEISIGAQEMNKTKIEYLTHTWNPLAMRCTPVSEGCKNCWHLAMAKRLANNPMLSYAERFAYEGVKHPVLKNKELEAPLHFKKPARIGVQFMGDLFHESISFKFQTAIFEIMATGDHWFYILTKRPQRMKEFFQACEDWDPIEWPGIWLGVSVEDQKTADERIPILLQIPAAHRWVSVEPMLGAVDLGLDKATCKCCPRWGSRWIRLKWQVTADWPLALINEQNRKMIAPAGIYRAESNPHGALSVNTSGGFLGVKPNEFEVLPKLDWVVCGGETGPGARPLHPDWVRSLRDQCQAAGVPFFFKGWGDKGEWEQLTLGHWYQKQGKKSHFLDGKEWRELPK